MKENLTTDEKVGCIFAIYCGASQKMMVIVVLLTLSESLVRIRTSSFLQSSKRTSCPHGKENS